MMRTVTVQAGVPHSHTWQLVNAPLLRYRCTDPTCNVVGYAPPNKRRQVIAYVCQLELENRKHCGEPATYVGTLRTQRRCAEHSPRSA